MTSPVREIQVKWDDDSAATPMGQLAYFIEFLNLTHLWSKWQEDCPLQYSSPNAPRRADVLGTWLLSILSDHQRYAHVTAIRGNGVNPELLGMRKVISEDSLRRALKAIPEKEGIAWLDQHLEASVRPLLDCPWILDIDTTIKPIYGKQEGAVVAYNLKKPERPSHCDHSYLIAGLRLVVGAEVRAGNEHAGQTPLNLTGLHARYDKARKLLMQVSEKLQAWAKERFAEQLKPETLWVRVCACLKQILTSFSPHKMRLLLADS